MSLGNGMVRRRNMVSFQRYSRRAREDVNSLRQGRCGRCRAGIERVALWRGGPEDELYRGLARRHVFVGPPERRSPADPGHAGHERAEAVAWLR